MKHLTANKNRIISSFLAFLIIVGLFSGIIPNTQLSAEAASYYKVLVWAPDTSSDAQLEQSFTTAARANRIINAYKNMSGINVIVKEKINNKTLSQSDVQGVQMIYLLLINHQAPSSYDLYYGNNIAILRGFLNGGGRLVMNGEKDDFCHNSNQALINLAKQFNVNFTIESESSTLTSMVFNTGQKSGLTNGCTNIRPSDFGPINPGDNVQAVYVMKDTNQKIFVMEQSVGAGNLVALADVGWLDAGGSANTAANNFLKNLLVDSAQNVTVVAEPIIIDQPQDLTWYYGDISTRTLAVNATAPGNGTLTYQWYKGDTKDFTPNTLNIVQGADSSSYSIPSPGTVPLGTSYYKCVVTNTIDGNKAVTTSNAAKVTVLDVVDPVIITQPQNLSWHYGDITARTLSVSATSPDGGALSYQWYKGNTPNFTTDSVNAVNGATSDSYSIPSPETVAIGTYYYKCVVKNSIGGRTATVTSNTATVSVLDAMAPDITLQPIDLSWYCGDTSARTILVAATSHDGGTLSYQWHKGNIQGFIPDNNNAISGAISANYSIPSPETITAGTYYYKCVVTNKNGSRTASAISNDATVTVMEAMPPVIAAQPDDLNWYYGDSTARVLSITATSQDSGNLTYQWYKGDSAGFIPDGSNIITGAIYDSFSVENPETVPIGTYYYKCIVTNTISTSSASVTSSVATVTVSEKKILSEVTVPPTSKHLLYNGSAQELIIAGTASGGTMVYALGTKDNPNGAWNTAIPTGISIGTYYIWYKAKGDEGYTDSEPDCVVSTIVQAYKVGYMETGVDNSGAGVDITVQGLTEEVAWRVVTDEEQDQINNNGAKGRLWLEITNIDGSVSPAERQIIENQANTLNEAKIGMLLDFSVFFQINDSSKRQLNSLNGKGISIELSIPAHLRASGTQRTYYLVSVHNGVSKIHGSTKTDKIRTTLTDFSTYALLYSDEEDEAVFKTSIKIKQTDTKIIVNWDKVEGVGKVEVYVAYCGKKYSKKPSMTTTKRKVTIKKINGKKLNQKKNYKMYLVAYDKKGNRIGKTVSCHFSGKNCKFTNPKTLKLSTNKMTLTVGESRKVKGKITYENKKKKPLSEKHAPYYRYVSESPEIATVDKKGNITGVTKGTTDVYVICQNGLSKKVKVTVK